jgi:hypothetical protein
MSVGIVQFVPPMYTRYLESKFVWILTATGYLSKTDTYGLSIAGSHLALLKVVLSAFCRGRRPLIKTLKTTIQ